VRASRCFHPNDLVEEGYVTRTRAGRRNVYVLSRGMPFRHPIEAEQSIDALLAVFGLRTDHDHLLAGIEAGHPVPPTHPP
jgi:hypothetical protein